MKDSELVAFLKAQNSQFQDTILSLEKTINNLSVELSALKETVLKQDNNALKLKQLASINLPKKTEKRNYIDHTSQDKSSAPTPRERGNNGAKRKVYDDIEEIVEEVLPSDSHFDEKSSVYLFNRDVIRYKYIPPRLIKYIYRCKSYRMGDNFFEGKAPIAPFLNSNFDSSFLAHLIQQRYVYGMPVERIIKYLNEMGINIPKSTIHGVIENRQAC